MYRNLHLTIWVTPLLVSLVLGLLSMTVRRGRLRELYERHFQEIARERLFLASVAFFVTIAIVRALTFSIHRGIGPFHDIYMHGRHIHHLVWGIFLLLFVGYCWLNDAGRRESGDANNWRGRVLALIYGMAAALTLDEFALWLNLEDVYWARQGHASIEAMFLFGALLATGVHGAQFFRAIGRDAMRLFRS
jgi:hypothetical protein